MRMTPRVLLNVVALVLVAAASGCAKPTSASVFLEYQRSGGFAGLDDRLLITPNGNATLTRHSQRTEFVVTRAALDQLQTLLEQAGFARLSGEYLPARTGADLLEYMISYQGHTVRTKDTAVPEALQPVLEALNRVIEHPPGEAD
jgi:hypothetical protein